MMRKRLPAGLRRSIIFSAGGHVGVVLLVLFAGSISSHSHKPPERFVTAKLVRLGKERPKDLLPRKPNPPPPPPPREIAIPESEPAKPQPKPEPRPRSTTKRHDEMSSVADALNRLKKLSDEPPEGHPNGSPEGEVTSLSDAIVGSMYATEIQRCIKENYTIEGISAERVAGRKAIVLVRVNTEGTFIDARILESSGLKRFDRAVERAVKRCGKVSPPPKEILERVRDDGIEIEFTP